MDVVGGYHLRNISSKKKTNGMTEFVEKPKEKTDKLH